MKIALITGITGQDGSYLAELLLQKGYQVHGLVRRCSTSNFSRIEHIKDRLVIHYGDITDPISIANIIDNVSPDEIYNLAAQSFVPVSWENPQYTMAANGAAILNILEPIRQFKLNTKVYQASTSEMFSGRLGEAPQDENTPKNPVNPYGIAKTFAYQTVKNYRKAYKMFCCNGILFNHESERRGEQFVTRKITLGVARIVTGLDDKIHLGNLDAMRDWGYAPDYVEAMWLMMQQDFPTDYVIGTGFVRSVRDLCRSAFEIVHLNWKDYVEIDKRFIRPQEVIALRANPQKAKKELNWQPKVGFGEMIRRMVEHDIQWIKKNK